MHIKKCLLAVTLFVPAAPAFAAPGDPIELSENVSLDLIANARIRYETVDQDGVADNADALTLRTRIGAMLNASNLQFLVEGEGTAALVDDYNDTIPGNGIEPFPVVADPESLELNRAQISYMVDGKGGTIGRQRIILDNARFVGNVGWRQNEQTFDALRGQARIGPVALDATYSISQRTIFGSDSPNEFFDGDFVFLNGGVELPVVKAKAFAYLIDYETRLAFSSQTYGVLANADIPLGPALKLAVQASAATQSDYMGNPADYSAEYYNLELGTSLAGFGVVAGYEELGSDGGVAAFQTPMATLHAFQGWADIFLTTPANGVRDYYATVRKQVALPAIGDVTAAVTYHEFESDFGGLDYGSEWDASLGFRLGPVGLLLKYANYASSGFASDTEKFWLQAEYSF